MFAAMSKKKYLWTASLYFQFLIKQKFRKDKKTIIKNIIKQIY